MTQSFKRSDSIGYKLSKWNDNIQAKSDEYLHYLQTLYTSLDQDTVPKIVELQKFQGKIITHSALNIKDSLIKAFSYYENQIIELIEFIKVYKVFIQEQGGLEFNFQTTKALIDLFSSDLETLESLKILMNDIGKGINVVYKLSMKSPKKYDEQIEYNYRSYIRLVKRLSKDYITFSNGFKSIMNQLANEVEIKVKLEQEKEMLLEKEQKNSQIKIIINK
ncbi:MAG TPA: hypothetical protein VMZ29_11520 [Candidatus Bathyarchaeia archaeon]|nr:hypothetical protein [Candidatus Bathyarchaeia archaeon]